MSMVEVVMGRRLEVVVRSILTVEGQRIGRTAKDSVKLWRSIVVLTAAQGQPRPDISHPLKCSTEYVRGVIYDFDKMEFTAPNARWRGGRPTMLSEQIRREICLTARCCPPDLGQLFSTRSLSKLAEHLTAIELVAAISWERIRRILHAGGCSWQATKPGRPPTILTV
jgi:hypothetical protein